MQNDRLKRADRYPAAYGPEEHRRALDRIFHDLRQRDLEARRVPDHERRAPHSPVRGPTDAR